jgi:hypothetical protein
LTNGYWVDDAPTDKIPQKARQNVPVFVDGFSRDDFAAFVRAVPWRFAKTMAHAPHEYTLRKQARERGLESEFESAVRLIREEGYRQRYGSKVYTYYDVEDGEGTVWQ